MRVLRIYPTANDVRHRRRDLALRGLGIEVALVVPDGYGSAWTHAPVERELPHRRARVFNKASIPLHLWDPLALRQAVREFDPDVVDVHEEPYFPAGAEATLVAGGRPVVMQSCQNIAKRFPLPIRAMRRRVLARLAGMYPCSQQGADVLREWGFRGRLAVVPYGVEDELFDVRSSGERVGFVGRLVPEKGVADLLSFGRRLLCVGDGPLAGAVREAGGEVVAARSTDELARQLARMAVLAAPSRTTPGWKEQFGRMVVEAMAAGVPVVAYSSGALPEVIGPDGVLVAEGDRAGLVEAIQAVLDDPRPLGERGRARARTHYRWETVAASMISLYRAVLQPDGHAAPASGERASCP
jgi:glycosyltransferase involved in cell wall biosynthesis